MTKLVHDVGGLVVVDHSAAAPYRLLDVKETDADVVAVNALAWGGPPIGAIVFRDPALINSFGSISTDPNATGPARLESRRAPVRPAGRRGRQHRVPGGTRRVRSRQPTRTSVGVDAVRRVVSEPDLRLPDGVAAVVAAGDGDRPSGGADTGGQLRAARGARRTGGAALGRQRNSGRAPTRVRGRSTCWASTTSAARSPSGWRTTRRRPRSTSWCARWRRWVRRPLQRSARSFPVTFPDTSCWCASDRPAGWACGRR